MSNVFEQFNRFAAQALDKGMTAAEVNAERNRLFKQVVLPAMQKKGHKTAGELQQAAKVWSETTDSTLRDLGFLNTDGESGKDALERRDMTRRGRAGGLSLAAGAAGSAANDIGVGLKRGTLRALGFGARFANDLGENEQGTFLDNFANAMNEGATNELENASQGYRDAMKGGVFGSGQGFGIAGLESIPNMLLPLGVGKVAASAAGALGANAGIRAGVGGLAALGTGFTQNYGAVREGSETAMRESVTPEMLRVAEKSREMFGQFEQEGYKSGLTGQDLTDYAYNKTIDQLSEDKATDWGLIMTALEPIAMGASTILARSGGGKYLGQKAAERAMGIGAGNAAMRAAVQNEGKSGIRQALSLGSARADAGMVGRQALEESLQGGVEAYAGQDAAAELGGTPVDWGKVATNAAAEGILGGIMGGGMQVASGNSPSRMAQQQLAQLRQQHQTEGQMFTQLAQGAQAAEMAGDAQQAASLMQEANAQANAVRVVEKQMKDLGIPFESVLPQVDPAAQPTPQPDVQPTVDPMAEQQGQPVDAQQAELDDAIARSLAGAGFGQQQPAAQPQQAQPAATATPAADPFNDDLSAIGAVPPATGLTGIAQRAQQNAPVQSAPILEPRVVEPESTQEDADFVQQYVSNALSGNDAANSAMLRQKVAEGMNGNGLFVLVRKAQRELKKAKQDTTQGLPQATENAAPDLQDQAIQAPPNQQPEPVTPPTQNAKVELTENGQSVTIQPDGLVQPAQPPVNLPERERKAKSKPVATQPEIETQPNDIGRPSDGKPFASERAAKVKAKADGLTDSHDVVSVGASAFVIRPKATEPVSASPVKPVKVKSVGMGFKNPDYDREIAEPARQAVASGNSVKYKDFDLVMISDSDDQQGAIVALDKNGDLAGSVDYVKVEEEDGTRHNPSVYVVPKHRREGLASEMYRIAEEYDGAKIPAIDQAGQARTDEGQAFRVGMDRKRKGLPLLPNPEPYRLKPVRTYRTKAGKVGAEVKESRDAKGRLTYSYSGEWGAGSVDADRMMELEAEWQATKRGHTVDELDGDSESQQVSTPEPMQSTPESSTPKRDSLLIAIDDELDSALDDLAAVFKSQSGKLNNNVDPVVLGKVLAIGAKASALYLAKGAVKFSIWAENMLSGLSAKGVPEDMVKPYLKQLYLASKVGVDPAIRKAMDKEDDVLDFDWDAGAAPAQPSKPEPITDEQVIAEYERVERRQMQQRTITQKNGEPFKTAATAQALIDKYDIADSHRVEQVDGGFVASEMPDADKADKKNKALGVSEYGDVQSYVIKKMGLAGNKKQVDVGDYGMSEDFDLTDSQWEAVEKQVDLYQKHQYGEARQGRRPKSLDEFFADLPADSSTTESSQSVEPSVDASAKPAQPNKSYRYRVNKFALGGGRFSIGAATVFPRVGETFDEQTLSSMESELNADKRIGRVERYKSGLKVTSDNPKEYAHSLVAEILDQEIGEAALKKTVDSMKAEQRKESDRQQLADYSDANSIATSWIDSIGLDLNVANKANLIRFVVGESDKYEGIVNWTWTDPLKKINAVSDDLKEIYWDKVRQSYQDFAKSEQPEAIEAKPEVKADTPVENSLFSLHQLVATQYGYSVDATGKIFTPEGKDTNVRIKNPRATRLTIISDSGTLFTGANPDGLGKFLEDYWFAKKKFLMGGGKIPAKPTVEPEQTESRLNMRDPEKVSMFNPYEDGDSVKIGDTVWYVKNETSGWYLTSTGDWKGKHPTISKVQSMMDLITLVQRDYVANLTQPTKEAEQSTAAQRQIASAEKFRAATQKLVDAYDENGNVLFLVRRLRKTAANPDSNVSQMAGEVVEWFVENLGNRVIKAKRRDDAEAEAKAQRMIDAIARLDNTPEENIALVLPDIVRQVKQTAGTKKYHLELIEDELIDAVYSDLSNTEAEQQINQDSVQTAINEAYKTIHLDAAGKKVLAENKRRLAESKAKSQPVELVPEPTPAPTAQPISLNMDVKPDPVAAMRAGKMRVHLNQPIKTADGDVTTIGKLIDLKISKGGRPVEISKRDSAAEKRLMSEFESLVRNAPIGNSNHPDTIRLNELKAMRKDPSQFRDGEFIVKTPDYRLESADGTGDMVLTKTGFDYAQSVIANMSETAPAAKQFSPEQQAAIDNIGKQWRESQPMARRYVRQLIEAGVIQRAEFDAVRSDHNKLVNAIERAIGLPVTDMEAGFVSKDGLPDGQPMPTTMEEKSSVLRKYGFIAEIFDRWKYATQNGKYPHLSADTEAKAVESAWPYLLKSKASELRTKDQKFDDSVAKSQAEMDAKYGKMSDVELRKEINRLAALKDELRKSGKGEFTGNGGRRTSAAVSNDGAREAGELLMRLESYAASRIAANEAKKKEASKEFDQIIKLAADSVQKLRKADVYRVMENTPADIRNLMADYIASFHPEYKEELGESLRDLAKEASDKKSATKDLDQIIKRVTGREYRDVLSSDAYLILELTPTDRRDAMVEHLSFLFESVPEVIKQIREAKAEIENVTDAKLFTMPLAKDFATGGEYQMALREWRKNRGNTEKSEYSKKMEELNKRIKNAQARFNKPRGGSLIPPSIVAEARQKIEAELGDLIAQRDALLATKNQAEQSAQSEPEVKPSTSIVHIEGKQKEVGTAKVVTKSLRKAQNDRTAAEYKVILDGLLADIDAAAKVAPAKPDASKDIPLRITFKVKGDGTFTVRNDKVSLAEFRAKVASSSGFRTVRAPSDKPKTESSSLSKASAITSIKSLISEPKSSPYADPYADQIAYEMAKNVGIEILAWEGKEGDIWADFVIKEVTLKGSPLLLVLDASSKAKGKYKIVSKYGNILASIGVHSTEKQAMDALARAEKLVDADKLATTLAEAAERYKSVSQSDLRAKYEAKVYAEAGLTADNAPKFSRKDTSDTGSQPRNLFVAHNLSADNILAAADLGGLAAPSIAVARSDVSDFSSFGEVTLLADPTFLEDSKIRTFDADIYSPRQPRASYELDYSGFNRLRDSLEPQRLLGLRLPDFEDASGQNGKDEFSRSLGMQHKFLEEVGKAPKVKPLKASTFVKSAAKLEGSRYQLEKNPAFIKIAEKYYADIMEKMAGAGRDRDFLQKAYYNEDGSLKESQIRSFADEVDRYKRSGGRDERQLAQDIRDKMKNQKLRNDFESWAAKQFDSLVVRKRMFDGYTNSGNRRYKPYTLETVVKAMTQQLQAGEQSFYGAGSVRSRYAKELKTLKAIQARRDSIITKQEMEEIKKQSDTVFMDAMEALKPFYKYDAKGFGYFEDAGSAIAEGQKGIREAFNLTPESRKIIGDLTEYLSNLGTEYFEAKAQRAVQFSEFNTAIVPKGMNKDALQVLRDAGLTIKTYDPKVEGDRTRVIAQQEKLLFSRNDDSRDEMNLLLDDLASFNVKDNNSVLDLDEYAIREDIINNLVDLAMKDEGFAGLALPAFGDFTVMITPSAKKSGAWQVTYFDGAMKPISDAGTQTKEKALRDFFQDVHPEKVAVDDYGNRDVLRSVAVWHGSPYQFERFSLEHLGRGEGAQAFGWGLYFAGNRSVAEHYKKVLSSMSYNLDSNRGLNRAQVLRIAKAIYPDRLDGIFGVDLIAGMILATLEDGVPHSEVSSAYKNYPETYAAYNDLASRITGEGKAGKLYRVRLQPDESDFLSLDEPLSEQKQHFDKLKPILDRLSESDESVRYEEMLNTPIAEWTGGDLIKALHDAAMDDFLPYEDSRVEDAVNNGDFPKAVSMYLHSLGIAGNRYLDGMSRGKDRGHQNYVLFDDSAAEIIEAYNSKDTQPQRPANAGQTVEQVRDLLTERFGADVVAKMEKGGKLVIVQSDAALAKEYGTGIEGFYDPATDKTTLVADNLTPRTVIPTLLHEMGGHAGFQTVMRPETYAAIMQQFDKMVEAGNPLAVRAKQRAERAESNPAIQRDEYLPYLITEASIAQDKKGGAYQAVMRLIDRAVAAVRAWAFDKLGVRLKLTPDDIVALAERMVKQAADPKGKPPTPPKGRSNADVMSSKQPRGATPIDQLFTPLRANEANRLVVRLLTDMWGGEITTAIDTVLPFRFKVVQSFSALPQEIQDGANLQGSDGTDIGGVFHDNTMYLVADNLEGDPDTGLTTAEMIKQVVFHEIYGHYGVHKLLGDDYKVKLQKLFDAIGGLDGLRQLAKSKGIDLEENYIKPAYDGENMAYWPLEEVHRHLMDELLAHLAQHYKPSVRQAAKELLGAVRNLLRKIGLAKLSKYNDADLAFILKEARHAAMQRSKSHVEQSQKDAPPQMIRFSRRDTEFEDAPVTPTNFKDRMKRRLREDISQGYPAHRASEFIRRWLGTPLHLSLTEPQFKPVFTLIQERLNHVSAEASHAIEVAPEILGRRETFADFRAEVKNAGSMIVQGKYTQNMQAAAKVLFDGTLIDKKVYSDAELTSKGLTADQVKRYREMRAAINTSLNQSAKAHMSKLAMFEEVFTGEEIHRLHDQDLSVPRHREQIEAKIDAALKALDPKKQEDKQQIKRLNEARKKIGDIDNRLGQLKEEGYAPLMRFGQHDLRVIDKATGDTVLYEMFETKRERDRARDSLIEANLLGDKYEMTTKTKNPEEYKLFREQGINPETFALFSKVAGLDSDQAYQAYLKLATAPQSAMRRLIHRKGIAGFSENTDRVMAAFVISNARRSANMLYSQDIESAVMKIDDGELQGYAQKLVAYINDPVEEMAALRSFLFFMNMGFSLRYGLLNLTQPYIQTLPELTRYIPAGRATKIVTSSSGTALKSMSDDNAIPAEFQKDYQMLKRKGFLEPQNIWALQGRERGRSATTSVWDVVLHSSGIIAQFTETVNRRTAMISALRTAKIMGADKLKAEGFDSAYDFAAHVIQSTQGVMNKGNRPQAARGLVGAPLFVFRTFSIQYVEQMIRMIKNPQYAGERDELRKALLLLMLILFGLAGATGLPFAKDLLDIFETGMSLSGNPVNFEREVQQVFGKEMAEPILYGAVNGFVFDMHGSTSMGDLLPATRMFHPDTDAARGLLEIGGATGGFLNKMGDSGALMMQGKVGDGVVNALPRFATSIGQGTQIATTGEFRTQYGNKLTDGTSMDAVLKIMDMNPSSLAQQGRIRMLEREDLAIRNAAQQKFRNRLIEAYEESDQAKIREIRADIADWNKDNPQYPVKIDYNRSIKPAIKRRSETWQERTNVPEGMEWMQDLRPD